MPPHRVLVTSLVGEGGMLSAIDWHGDAGRIAGYIRLEKAPHVIAVHPREPIAYVACWGEPSEIVSVGLHADGTMVDLGDSGALPVVGAQPCSLAIDPRGRCLIVASYDGGITVVPLRGDGRFDTDVPQTLHLAPPPAREGRQDASHPHFVGFDPGTDRVVAIDLGSDLIYSLELSDSGRSIDVQPPPTIAPAGSGPRHAAFFARGRMLVSDELSSSASIYVREDDSYRLLQSVSSTVRAVGANFPSDIVADARSRLGFVGNRGADTIGVLRLDVDGIALIGEYDSGRWPLSLEVTDDVLHCAVRDDDALSSWRVDESGELSELPPVPVPSPTWVARR